MFRGFLRSEFSEENLAFWLACEDYRVSPSNLQKTKAGSIYNQFINPDAPQEVGGGESVIQHGALRLKEVCEQFKVSRIQSRPRASSDNPFFSPQVNLDAETREALLSVMDSLCADTFSKAQQRIYSLMAKDSFPRFLRSPHCMEAVKAF